MNYLAIDTSGKNLTIIICKNGEHFEYFDSECGVSHSIELMPKIEELALSCNFDFKSADFFACAIGPGSFTGIRIGVATVKALCFAYKKPCLSVTSLDTISYNIESGKSLCLIDAKHDGFYVAGYQYNTLILEPEYMMKDKVQSIKDDFDLVLSSTLIDGIESKMVSVKDGLIKAIEKNAHLKTYDYDTINPLYVRKSQAEEGR